MTPIEAAAEAIAKRRGCDLGTFTVCWGEYERGEECGCKAEARAAVLAFLQAAKRDSADPWGDGRGAATIVALTRMAEGECK